MSQWLDSAGRIQSGYIEGKRLQPNLGSEQVHSWFC